MTTSSLWRSGEVVAWRQARFAEWRLAGAPEIAGVPAFNLLEIPGRREWSPLMTRPISITRSLTQAELRAGADRLVLRYWRRDGESAISPGEPTAVAELELAKASAAS